MNSTRTQSPSRREAGLREAGLHELLMDALRVGPAPTRSREAFVVVLTLVVLGVLLAVLRPEVFVVAVASALVVGFLAIRWIVGNRQWNKR